MVTSGPSGTTSAEPRPDARTRLANRVALLTFLTAFAVVATLVSVPRALEGGGAIPRILAWVFPLAGAAVVFALRKARVELRAARESPDADGPAPAGD